MIHVRSLTPLVTAALVALSASSAPGQYRSTVGPVSHVPVGGNEMDLAQALAARFRATDEMKALDGKTLQQLLDLQKSMSPQQLQQMQDLIRRYRHTGDANDPALQKAMRELLQKSPQLRDPATRERLRRLTEQMRNRAPGQAGTPSPLELPLDQFQPPILQPGLPSGPPSEGPAPGTPDSPDGPAPSPAPPSPGPAPSSTPGPQMGPEPTPGQGAPPSTQAPPPPKQGDPRLREMAKWLEGQMGSLSKSSEFQRALRNLTQPRTSDGKPHPELERLKKLFERAAGTVQHDLSGLSRPRWLRINPRSFDGSRWHLPSVHPPSLGAPSMPSGGGDALAGVARPFAVLGAVGVLLLAVVLFLRGAKQRREGRSVAGFALGSWPVDPALVADRAQFIRAFEYLAVLLCGLSARAWNHLALAERLADPGDHPRAAAARRLAELYAESRYAPAAPPLPAEELAGARHDLLLLAGAPRS